MAPQNIRFFDRRKFVWDGEVYDSSTMVEARRSDYEAHGFETQLVEEEGKLLLYTRRVVKEVIVEGTPPPG